MKTIDLANLNGQNGGGGGVLEITCTLTEDLNDGFSLRCAKGTEATFLGISQEQFNKFVAGEYSALSIKAVYNESVVLQNYVLGFSHIFLADVEVLEIAYMTISSFDNPPIFDWFTITLSENSDTEIYLTMNYQAA